MSFSGCCCLISYRRPIRDDVLLTALLQDHLPFTFISSPSRHQPKAWEMFTPGVRWTAVTAAVNLFIWCRLPRASSNLQHARQLADPLALLLSTPLTSSASESPGLLPVWCLLHQLRSSPPAWPPSAPAAPRCPPAAVPQLGPIIHRVNPPHHLPVSTILHFGSIWVQSVTQSSRLMTSLLNSDCDVIFFPSGSAGRHRSRVCGVS